MPDIATATARLLPIAVCVAVFQPAVVLLCRTCALHCGTTSLSIWIRNDNSQPTLFATSRRSPIMTTASPQGRTRAATHCQDGACQILSLSLFLLSSSMLLADWRLVHMCVRARVYVARSLAGTRVSTRSPRQTAGRTPPVGGHASFRTLQRTASRATLCAGTRRKRPPSTPCSAAAAPPPTQSSRQRQSREQGHAPCSGNSPISRRISQTLELMSTHEQARRGTWATEVPICTHPPRRRRRHERDTGFRQTY